MRRIETVPGEPLHGDRSCCYPGPTVRTGPPAGVGCKVSWSPPDVGMNTAVCEYQTPGCLVEFHPTPFTFAA